MEYAVEMGSVAMIYTPSFIKVDIGGYAETGCRSHKPTLGK
jgi:hypothetical protein